MLRRGYPRTPKRDRDLKIAVVTDQLPLPEGSAAGRTLWAWCSGARELGHDLEVWSWCPRLIVPRSEVPGWCHWEPFENPPNEGPMWREHLRALARPRWDLARWAFPTEDEPIAIAEEAWSYPAIASRSRSAVTLHFSRLADAIAVRRLSLALVQDARAERRAARRVPVAFAYSRRVARYVNAKAHVVPIGYAAPPEALVPSESPVAAVMADWHWPPNQRAFRWLMAAWPDVVARVPGARLVVGGRGLEQSSVGALAGVTVLGAVGKSADVLSQASVVAFPCPPSSGPKVKVLEALAFGLPVVTTPAGVEGLCLKTGEGALVVPPRDFASGLARLLSSPKLGADLGRSGRAAALEHHSPLNAAQARLQVFADTFGPSEALL